MNTEVRSEARTSIENLLTTLKESLAQPGQSLIPLLTTMSRFTRYSLSNQLLIFAQRLTATHVLGYRSWLKAGYVVWSKPVRDVVKDFQLPALSLAKPAARL